VALLRTQVEKQLLDCKPEIVTDLFVPSLKTNPRLQVFGCGFAVLGGFERMENAAG
jgi:hypothetical protein